MAFGIASLLLLLLAFGALTSDFFSVNPPGELNLDGFFCPPTRIHFFDLQGRFHWRPFVCSYDLADPLDVLYVERCSEMHPIQFFPTGYGYRLLGLIPTTRHMVGTGTAGTFYPLGADELGRDILSRVLAGSRTSLLVVFVGALTYAALAFIIGSLAGFAGGLIDTTLMRTSEFIMAVPALYLILALRTLLPLKLPYWQTVLLIAVTIAAVTWPPIGQRNSRPGAPVAFGSLRLRVLVRWAAVRGGYSGDTCFRHWSRSA